MIIKIAYRKKFDREGLIDMIQEVLSDDDTNGKNGLEYLSEEAEKYLTEKDVPIDKWSDDLYHRYQIMDLPLTTSETEICQKYISNLYTMMPTYKQEISDFITNETGEVMAIAYAASD